MTAVGDFPSNCSTNTIILQDFGEVAYIVCTVSIPPQSHNASQNSSPENNLVRLRQTEQQFRQASILASIDTETQQLFTFYKKVDVLKDQKIILAKFGQILRSSCCTIAYKAAARAPELFKTENSRIYRLFVTAVLAGISVVADDGRPIIPLGPRYHAIQLPEKSTDLLSQHAKSWTLLRTDLQMVLSGQIIVAISEQRKLFPLDAEANGPKSASVGATQPRATPVVLAPTGQLAIYKYGWVGRLIDGQPAPGGLSSHLLTLVRIWQALFTDWAQREPSSQTHSDESWVELIIPVQEQLQSDQVESPSPPKKVEPRAQMSFKSLFWPAKLCFAFNPLRPTPMDQQPDSGYDPIQFILDWFETLKDGDVNLSRSKSQNGQSENDDASIFQDEGTFDHAETFQPFGPPAFPASQTVYPTPPDVVMTHATPAMSSIDGLAATPATMARSGEPNPARQDGSLDTQGEINTELGSGLYDEDLFEDMPGDNFGEANAADEPNWDFFDKPTNDGETIDSMDIDTAVPSGELGIKAVEVNGAEQIHDETEIEGTSSADNAKAAEQNEAAANLPTGHDDEDMVDEPVEQVGHDVSPQQSERRRSSVFDGIQRPNPSPKRDRRYTAAGSFYFDAQKDLKQLPSIQHRNLNQWIRRSPSLSDTSGSEYSGYATPVDADSPLDFKIPTPGLLQEELSPFPAVGDDAVETKELEADARSVFDLVSVPLTRATLDEAIVSGRPAGLGAQFDKPGVRNGFAHEIVYQITQTSLLRKQYAVPTLEVDGNAQKSAVLSGTSLAESTTFSPLSSLCGLTSPSNTKGPLGRSTRLIRPEITMKRLDQQITTGPGILPFWDTLGLQPHPKSKDVTAFCLHPHGQGVADSCLDFLNRIADSYMSCNLGQHSTGHIPGVTSNGLLEADPTDHGMYLGPVRRLGEALAKPTQQGGTLVVYLIASSDNDMAFVYCSVASYAIRRHVEQGWAKRSEQLNLVFQVVPPSFVTSSSEVVVPSQNEYNVLALGVYSRIPPHETESPLGICEYPLILPEGRDGINFELEAGVTSPLLRQGAHLHLCYAFSDDRRWILSVWTDVHGHIAFFMPYQIKSSMLSPPRPIDEIIKDMWNVSQDLMVKNRTKWKLVVSRVGTVEAPEVNGWMMATNNAQSSNGRARCSLYLLSIELKPTFRLYTQAEPSSNAQNAYGTPASTPQGGVTSPEQMVAATPTSGGAALNAPTPPEYGFDPNADSDILLADPIEDSWAVLLPFGVNQSKDILEIRPAIASGYLVKRLGSRDDSGLTMLGVHMIWPTPNVTSTTHGQREEEMEEFLIDFRGLVTLAGARGVIDSSRSCIPWHIHTATAGSTALGRLI